MDKKRCPGERPGQKTGGVFSSSSDSNHTAETPDLSTESSFQKAQPDRAEIRRAIDLIRPSGVVEVRGIKGKATAAGYFDEDHHGHAVSAAEKLNRQGFAVYVPLNPINPQLMGRYCNRIEARPTSTAKDSDVLRREWLLIDCDPVRPSGTSATREQLNAARQIITDIQFDLDLEGWPEPVVALSGNGYHLIYKIDLPNDQESAELVKAVLKTLADRYSSDAVQVDQSVWNAARITKLYGTVANKGDHTAATPHRLSRVLSTPKTLHAVTAEQLRALVPERDPLAALAAAQPSWDGGSFDLEAFIEDGLKIEYERDIHDGRTRYKLSHCPFNSDHGRGEAAIFQDPSGKLGFKCFHDSCADKSWRDVRELVQSDTLYAGSAELCGELPEAFTDTRVAEFFARSFSDRCRWCPEMGKYLLYDGTRWTTGTPGGPYPLFKKMLNNLYGHVRSLADGAQRQTAIKALATLEGHRKQQTVLDAAAVVPEMIIGQEQLDADPMRLNCRNGTVDLCTGELCSHSSYDLITRLVNIDFDPTASCPTFLNFLGRVMDGNQGLIDYLQRFVGYCLTGKTSEQVLVFMHGHGANGKTTFANVLEWLLGDFAATAGADLLMHRDGRGATNDLAALRGRRLVKVSEFDDGERLAEAQIKTLTGGDRINCRFLYQEFFEYTPQFKILLLGNYKPKIRGRDYGIWRRIHLVPFAVTIPESDRDPDLADKLRVELPGILAWAVCGCLEWQRVGLAPPAEVQNAVEDYKAAEDVFGEWLQDCCDLGAQYRASASELLNSFVGFSNWRAISTQRFGKMLRDGGFAKVKSHGAIFWEGLQVSEISNEIEDWK